MSRFKATININNNNVDNNNELLTYPESEHTQTKKKAGVLYFTSLKPPYHSLLPNEEASCSSSRCLSGLDRIYFAPESQQPAGNSPQLQPGATLTSSNSCLGNRRSTQEQFRCNAALCCIPNQTAIVVQDWPFKLEMDTRHHNFIGNATS